MEVSDVVASTAEAAFATSEDGQILAWNDAARRLLGYPAADVLGRRCFDVLGGTDVFGNRFCDEICPLRRMAGRHEAVRHFELLVRRATEERVRVDVSVLVVPAEEPFGFTVVHHLQPVESAGPRPSTEPARERLTRREMEVLGLLAEGRGTREIAETLFVSDTTARNHIQHILRKLDAHSRLEAVAIAHRDHLV